MRSHVSTIPIRGNQFDRPRDGALFCVDAAVCQPPACLPARSLTRASKSDELRQPPVKEQIILQSVSQLVIQSVTLASQPASKQAASLLASQTGDSTPPSDTQSWRSLHLLLESSEKRAAPLCSLASWEWRHWENNRIVVVVV